MLGNARQAILVIGINKGVLIGSAIEQALVYVHTGAVDPKDWFGHEGRMQSVLLRNSFERVLEGHCVVGSLERRSVTEVDLMLPDRDFVVRGFNRDPHILQGV